MATGRLMLWSSARGEWVACPPDEITWLDRDMLSGNEDLTLHRAPRCAGLRYVHHRWELFSRDTTYRVYLAPHGGAPGSAEAVQRAARHVLPAAPARYEALPVVLEAGAWLVSVANWVLRLRLDVGRPARTRRRAGRPGHPGREGRSPRVRAPARRRSPGSAATSSATPQRGCRWPSTTRSSFSACPPRRHLPMMDVVVALDLSGEGAVSDYKKLLQGLIWKERGHARDLPDFLLSNGLLTPADLDEARQDRRGQRAARRLGHGPAAAEIPPQGRLTHAERPSMVSRRLAPPSRPASRA